MATQTVTRYELDGSVSVIEIEVPDQPLSPELVAATAIRSEIDTRLADPNVNSIAEIKSAIRDGLAAAVESLTG